MTSKALPLRELRSRAHALKPVVHIGVEGVTAAVIAELDRALDHHELLKIRLRVGDREARDAAIGELCRASGAALVQRIGNVAVLYREGAREDDR